MKTLIPFTGFYHSHHGDIHLEGILNFTKEHEFHANLRDSGIRSPTRMWHGFARFTFTPNEIRVVDCHARATVGRTIYILRVADADNRELPGKYTGFRYELPQPISFTSNGNAFLQGFNPITPGSYRSKVHAELTLQEALRRER